MVLPGQRGYSEALRLAPLSIGGTSPGRGIGPRSYPTHKIGGIGTVSAHVTAGWKFEEAAGLSRVDVLGVETLTDHATVGQNTGILGNAADFTRASSHYLSRADDASLSIGGVSFSISGWVYHRLVTGAHYYTICSKFSDSGADYGYALVTRPDNSQVLGFIGWSTGANWSHPVWGGITQLVSTWYHYVLTHDESLLQDTLYFNSVSQGAVANTHGSRDDTNEFQVGATVALNNGDAGGTRNFMDGRIDSLYLFRNYVLTQSDVNALYNSGAGADYPNV